MSKVTRFPQEINPLSSCEKIPSGTIKYPSASSVSPSLISLMVSVDVKHHVYLLL